MRPPCAGGVSGGTQVFGAAFASLFGASTNVLSYADVNTWDDNFAGLGDNGRITQNTAAWLGAVAAVPEPATWALVALGLAPMGVVRRRRA